MSRNYTALEDSLSASYKSAGGEATGARDTEIPQNSKTKKEKPKKTMPSTLDGKVYAFPGEILTGNADSLQIGQNAYVPLSLLVLSEVTKRDSDFESEIAKLKLSTYKPSESAETEDGEDMPDSSLTPFQALYLDIQKNGQVDALKVYRSKLHPGKLEPIEGNRRLVALREHGYQYAYVTLYPEPASTLDLVRLSQSFNQKRDKHSIFDLGKQWHRLTQEKVKQETIAKELGVSKSYVSKAITVFSLYDGTRFRIQNNPKLFSEKMAIELAFLEKRLQANDIKDSGFKVLHLVREIIDFGLEPAKAYALMKSREAAWQAEKNKEQGGDSTTEEKLKLVKEKNPFKLTSRLYVGEHSEPVGFLSVDSQSKSIRVGVNFGKIEQPDTFLDELKLLVEKHGLRKNIEPKIFNDAEVGERIEALSKKEAGAQQSDTPDSEVNLVQ